MRLLAPLGFRSVQAIGDLNESQTQQHISKCSCINTKPQKNILENLSWFIFQVINRGINVIFCHYIINIIVCIITKIDIT